MAKILVMTDLHITEAGNTIIGLDPAMRLSETLAHAVKHHPDASHLILTGDLTHHGTTPEYDRLKDVLHDLPWPVSYLIGNHDDRATFRQAFPEVPTDADGFVQTVIDLPDTRLILLDTVDENAPNPHAGRLCPSRLAWLQTALSESPNPCLVFMHHHAFDTGFTGMDRINLANAAAVRALLKTHNTRHVFAGHVHRTIHATVDGLSMTVFKSPCHQQPLTLGDDASSSSIDEPAGYGILLTDGPNVVVHFEDVGLPEKPVLTY
ncbi:MAG: phosphodiesterase [Boseongicola sp.]|nr:phosphodiesterase [Boseongicola sp.]